MAKTLQRSFTSGELSPGLRVRADLGKYATGLTQCKNFLVKAQGGAFSRPGTRYVTELDDSTKRGRVISFSFNTEQTYVLVFEHLKMRVIRDGGIVLAGGGPSIYEIATPYTEAQLSRISFTQSADVMTLVHPSHDPRNLSRLADDNWTLAVINYAPTTAVPTGLASASIGTASGADNKKYVYVVTAIGADGSESLASASESKTQDALSVTYGITLTWTAVAGAEYYKVYKGDSINTGVYGFIGESKTEEFNDFNIAPDITLAPPEARTPFTGADNNPAAVTYYQQRQLYANSNNEPQTMWATQTSNYKSLRTSRPARANDAVTLTIAGTQVNEIRHIISVGALILMTSGSEWIVTEGQDDVLAPDTVGVKIQSYNGASFVAPVVINDTVLFVQEKGSKIRDLGYEFTSDKYTGNDLSIMSNHLFEGFTIDEMTYASEPYGILWAIRSDGVLLGMTYQREQQVWGWHQHDTQGLFESITTITEDGRDAPYVIVKRTIEGVTRRYVERIEPREETLPEDCFFVDSGLSYDGVATTNISGLDHLEGEAVAVLADGNVVENLTVVSGAITLPRAATKVHVGLSYEPELVTLAIDTTQDILRGKKKSVGEVRVITHQSRGLWVGPVNDVEGPDRDLLEVKPRIAADAYATMPLRSTEEKISIQPGWNDDGMVRIVQRSPLPLAILAILPDVDMGG